MAATSTGSTPLGTSHFKIDTTPASPCTSTVNLASTSTSACASTLSTPTRSTSICISPDRSTHFTTPTPPTLSLPGLPLELHLMLFDCLDYQSLLQLGATSKQFRCLIRREHIVAALYRDEDVVHNFSSISKERLACFQCYRLRSAFYDFGARALQPEYLSKGREAGRRRCLICLMPSSGLAKLPDKKNAKLCPGTFDVVRPNRRQAPPEELFFR